MPVKTEVDDEHDDTENQTNHCHKRQSFAPRLRLMRSAVDLGVVHELERCLIEIAADVRVRIEEEALGATLHGTGGSRIQNLKGFLRMRPVFLRIEPTFESSFFGSAVGLVV